jgi:hypothetical protein
VYTSILTHSTYFKLILQLIHSTYKDSWSRALKQRHMTVSGAFPKDTCSIQQTPIGNLLSNSSPLRALDKNYSDSRLYLQSVLQYCIPCVFLLRVKPSSYPETWIWTLKVDVRGLCFNSVLSVENKHLDVFSLRILIMDKMIKIILLQWVVTQFALWPEHFCSWTRI